MSFSDGGSRPPGWAAGAPPPNLRPAGHKTRRPRRREHDAMSPSYPTLAELRLTAQKGRHREIGNWLARRVARPSAIYGTWLVVRLGLSAHQVTLAALAA